MKRVKRSENTLKKLVRIYAEVVVKTGFRTTMRKKFDFPMPEFIFQSDHSVSSGVSGHTYDYIVNLVREYGKYPLQLGAFDEVL